MQNICFTFSVCSPEISASFLKCPLSVMSSPNTTDPIFQISPCVETTVFSLCIMHNILSIPFPLFTFSIIFSEIWWNWMKNVKWCLTSNLHSDVMNFPLFISYSLFMHPKNLIYIWFISTVLFTTHAVHWIASLPRYQMWHYINFLIFRGFFLKNSRMRQ